MNETRSARSRPLGARGRAPSPTPRAIIGRGPRAIAVALVVVASAALAAGPARSAAALSTAACRREAFEGSDFTVCPFASDRQDLKIAFDDRRGRALRSFAALGRALGADRDRLRFAMNAGMFDARGAPIGLLIADGRERRRLSTRGGAGNFYLQPNGVFSLDADGAIHVETTQTYAERAPMPRWASQSGPMLVIDGALNPLIRKDGPSRYRRNGVAIIDSGHAAFVISDAPVSFGRLARFFRDRLHCGSALYFDGAVSSLWAPDEARRDDDFDLGPMIAAFDRAPGAH